MTAQAKSVFKPKFFITHNNAIHIISYFKRNAHKLYHYNLCAYIFSLSVGKSRGERSGTLTYEACVISIMCYILPHMIFHLCFSIHTDIQQAISKNCLACLSRKRYHKRAIKLYSLYLLLLIKNISLHLLL